MDLPGAGPGRFRLEFHSFPVGWGHGWPELKFTVLPFNGSDVLISEPLLFGKMNIPEAGESKPWKFHATELYYDLRREWPMMYPESVLMTEVGPRDGLQMETRTVPTDEKVALINGLAQAGLQAIQVASFVHPSKVPQMADAESVIARLPRDDGVQYSGLALNHKGVLRALQTWIPWIEISVAASDSQSRRNAGLPLSRLRDEIDKMMNAALGAGRRVRASIQCSFGCTPDEAPADAEVLEMAETLVSYGIHQLILADTTGMATPPKIKRLLGQVLPVAAGAPVGLHLHDTRGMGMVNVMAGLETGVSHFDTSLGGLGGCPFVQGAAGNIATEDTAYLMDSLSIQTGIDIFAVACWSRRLSRFFGRTLQGKLYRLLPGSPENPPCS
jgi:hydroxymethylglutaryl-CoA lyase